MTPAWLPDTVTTDLDRIVSRALLWGVEALELRLVGGATRRVPHVNEPPLRRRLEESELAVASITPGLFEGDPGSGASAMDDLARLDDSLAFCRRFGCPVVVVSSFQGGEQAGDRAATWLRRAGDRAARAGVTLAVANEPGMVAADPDRLGELLNAVSHPAVAAALDLGALPAGAAGDGPPVTASALDSALSAAAALAGCAALVRWGSPEPGSAAVPPGDVARVLRRAGFDGPVSMVLPVGASGKEGLHRATALVSALRAVS